MKLSGIVGAISAVVFLVASTVAKSNPELGCGLFVVAYLLVSGAYFIRVRAESNVG